MGLICSCFCVEDIRNPYGSLCRPCGCLSFLSQRFMLMYTLLLQREEHAAPSSSSSLASVAPITDESYSSTFRSPPRPLAFDDPIFTRKRDDGPARRHEKTFTHPYEESESLSRVKNEGKIEPACLAAKLCGYNCGVSTKCCSESSQKHSSTEIMSGATYMFPSSEEEDVCPTCLEGEVQKSLVSSFFLKQHSKLISTINLQGHGLCSFACEDSVIIMAFSFSNIGGGVDQL